MNILDDECIYTDTTFVTVKVERVYSIKANDYELFAIEALNVLERKYDSVRYDYVITGGYKVWVTHEYTYTSTDKYMDSKMLAKQIDKDVFKVLSIFIKEE